MGDSMQSDGSILERRWTRTTVSRTIAADPTQVWAAIADHAQWLEWYRPLKSFELVQGTALAVGAVVSEQEGLWKATSEVTELIDGQRLGLAMRSLNLPGLLSGYYRRIDLQPTGPEQRATEVTLTGGFTFGPLGWLLVAYTYPQMAAASYFEYRSALNGLAAFFDDGDTST